MRIAEILLAELDAEIKNTQRLFDRIPEGKGGYKPHEKSMVFEKLARHIATLPSFGKVILTTSEMDMANGFPSLPTPTTKDEFKETLEVSAGELRAALEKSSDEQLEQTWTLKMGDKVFFNGNRILGYRSLFLNHFIHHRAQLGVYLRLLDCPIPGMYGPSADDMTL